jgi:hypothetical protein
MTAVAEEHAQPPRRSLPRSSPTGWRMLRLRERYAAAALATCAPGTRTSAAAGLPLAANGVIIGDFSAASRWPWPAAAR